jgi:hypothetical protein
MPNPGFDRDTAARAVEYFQRYGSKKEAAKAMGVSSESSFYRMLKAASKFGMMGTKPVLPGYYLHRTSTQLGPDGELQREWVQQKPEPGEEFAVPDGHIVKGVSALLDADGRTVQQWVKTREGTDPVATVEAIKAAFEDFAGRADPTPPPTAANSDLLNLLPCNDWHTGVYIWGEEASENWDLDKAERVIGQSVEEALWRSPSAGTCIVLGGGDQMHADTNDNRTANSGHALDVDGRHQKVLGVTCRLFVRTTDTALLRNERVVVRILPGNHDPYSSVALAYFLLAWYRNEPRVTVDVDPSLFFWFRHGLVLLGATHGHTVKVAQMPAIMAHRKAEDWGQTRFRYVHGFHLHHTAKTATEGNGVITETHQAPIPQDAWHWGSGFLSGRSIQTITYHQQFGEISRCRVAIMDAPE